MAMIRYSAALKSPRIRPRTVILAAALCLLVAFPILAQDPAAAPAQLGAPMPPRQPRPAKGPGSIPEFVKDLSANDALFEVTVGQSRILSTKSDIAVPGKARALVAVGDPSVIDFVVLNSRQIRVVGKRVGVTDLVISTSANETYSFEVRVVVDLTILHAQLKKTFPDATVRMSQIRDHIILEGNAPDPGQVVRIVETVKAYMLSVFASQLTKITSPQQRAPAAKAGQPPPKDGGGKGKDGEEDPADAAPEAQRLSIQGKQAPPKIINLLVVDHLALVQLQLRRVFPDASVTVSGVGGSIILEGQARDTRQVKQIEDTVRSYFIQVAAAREETKQAGETPEKAGDPPDQPATPSPTIVNVGTPERRIDAVKAVDVINLIRVPGSRQVMLKVKVAELNRTALRQIGTNFLYSNGGTTIGSRIGGDGLNAQGSLTGFLTGAADIATSGATTLFGVFENADFAVFFNALRKNSLLKILAEPNLVALSGHQASFLAGGSFPVPVPQSTGGAGGTGSVTIEWKDFGVKLAFLPNILDGDSIRLAVDPEVSSIDFTIGTVLVPGGTPVPGINTRRAHTIVEIKEGQTLAIAGLLQVTLDGTTSRIPGLGDLPILGPFFSNTSGQRQEKELIVLVTPYLVEPMKGKDVPPAPGECVNEPTDLEFYLGNRIEGRSGRDFRSTVNYECRLPALRSLMRLEELNIRGPHGFCD